MVLCDERGNNGGNVKYFIKESYINKIKMKKCDEILLCVLIRNVKCKN